MGLWEDAHKPIDALGVGEALSIAKSGKGFTKGAEKYLGPLGTAFAAVDTVKGGYEGAEAIDKGDGVEGCDAVHDVLSGGAGLLGNAGGTLGAGAKAFGAGMAVGDAIAPVIFGSEEEDNKAHTEEVPADGVFKPSTGNSYVDGALDFFGVR